MKSDEERSGSSEGEGDDDDSSIDMDGDENEEKLYEMIQADQKKAGEIKSAKEKGDHLNDLVDKEMIHLL